MQALAGQASKPKAGWARTVGVFCADGLKQVRGDGQACRVGPTERSLYHMPVMLRLLLNCQPQQGRLSSLYGAYGALPQLALRGARGARAAPAPSPLPLTMEVDVGGIEGVGHVDRSLLGGTRPIHVTPLCTRHDGKVSAGWGGRPVPGERALALACTLALHAERRGPRPTTIPTHSRAVCHRK